MLAGDGIGPEVMAEAVKAAGGGELGAPAPRSLRRQSAKHHGNHGLHLKDMIYYSIYREIL